MIVQWENIRSPFSKIPKLPLLSSLRSIALSIPRCHNYEDCPYGMKERTRLGGETAWKRDGGEVTRRKRRGKINSIGDNEIPMIKYIFRPRRIPLSKYSVFSRENGTWREAPAEIKTDIISTSWITDTPREKKKKRERRMQPGCVFISSARNPHYLIEF